MNDKINSGLVVGLFAYIVGSINLVTIALLMFMLIDFLTGVLGAYRKGEGFTNQKAAYGIIKKTGIMILWFLSVVIQLVINTHGEGIGITFNTPYINLAMTFYLLGTETISILKNLSKMGVKTPKWFRRIAEGIKNSNEERRA